MSEYGTLPLPDLQFLGDVATVFIQCGITHPNLERERKLIQVELDRRCVSPIKPQKRRFSG